MNYCYERTQDARRLSFARNCVNISCIQQAEIQKYPIFKRNEAVDRSLIAYFSAVFALSVLSVFLEKIPLPVGDDWQSNEMVLSELDESTAHLSTLFDKATSEKNFEWAEKLLRQIEENHKLKVEIKDNLLSITLSLSRLVLIMTIIMVLGMLYEKYQNKRTKQS